MYINKTSRRIIFLNAVFLAVIIFWIAENIHKNSSLFNSIFSLYVFSFSVIFESLRYLKNKKKLKKIIKNIKNETYLNNLEPCEELSVEMEETKETDRM